MPQQRKIRNDILAVGLLALIVFLAAALGTHDSADPIHDVPGWLNQIYQPDRLVYPGNERVTNACGFWGAWISDLLINSLGWGAYYLVLGLVAMEIALFRQEGVDSPILKTLGWLISLVGLTSLFSILIPQVGIAPLIGPGGYLGMLGKSIIAQHFGLVGGVIVSSCVSLVGLMMWTEYLVFRAGRIVFAPALVGIASLLPIGLIANWICRVREDWGSSGHLWRRRPHRQEPSEDADSRKFGNTVTLRLDGEQNVLAPRTIKFRRRDLVELSEEGEEFEELASHQDEDLISSSDFEPEEEAEAHEYDTIEEEAVVLKIGTEKSPDPSQVVEPEPPMQEVSEVPIPKPHFKMKKGRRDAAPSERDEVIQALNQVDETEDIVHYTLPSIEMLSHVESVPFESQKRDAERNAIILEKTCKEFGYDVRVVEIEIGPVISQYEIELAPGLRLQKIVALADDIAIAMRVPSVRIVAPIPGKNSVGVEVPNKARQIVGLRQLMEQSEKEIQKMKIPLFLGADAVGAPLVADLASLPHLLIAGRTGTGKSVCLNSIISSILMTRRPDEVRMLMIDPKMVELSGYGRLPHLMHPVVTDMRKAEAILAWAVDKMEERYALLARAGVRHVTSYNQLGDEEIMDRLGLETREELANVPTNLPFIVIIADEMADLMMTAGKEVEAHIIRLAQKSRAVGIHLILATQKPTVDVITGLIKSNLPARIAFQVASKTDSRVVLDEGGADKLLGMGDMLFLAPGTSTLLRGQGTYLSDREIEMITEAVSTGEQDFVQELVNIKLKSEDEEESSEGGRSENRDKLYEEAVTMVVREQRGSTSMLQQKLQIGYGRAARLIDFMAEDGYLGPYNGSKARDVLLTEAQWEAIRSGRRDASRESEDFAAIDGLFDDSQTQDGLDIQPAQPRKPHFSKRPLKPLEKNTGLASNLAANSVPVPPSTQNKKPSIHKDQVDDLDDHDFDSDDLEDATEMERGDDPSLQGDYQDIEAAADDYEAADDDFDLDDYEDDSDDDYEYEDDSDYEDV